MVELAVAGCASLAASLYRYNRNNFMFDNEIRIEREYQIMKMRIKQFELYREDIRDLVDLTVVKMDKYLIVNTLQMGFCLTMITEGRPEAESSREMVPIWILQIQFLCIIGAFLYYILSVWLAMHASMAAHAFGVRLLTQFVRLPLPNAKDLDDARGLVQEDYEGAEFREMFRIPVWKQQLRKLNAAMADLTTDHPDVDEMSEQRREDADADGGAEEMPPAGTIASPVAMLQHVRMFRKVQANWQSYDAYARVCMALGSSQFLIGLSYYVIGALISAADTVWPAFSCVVVFASCAWIVARLDLYLTRRILLALGLMLYVPPLLGFISVWFQKKKADQPGPWKDAWRLLMPIATLLHIGWIIFTVYIARARDYNKVALPFNFRSVLYLDVFHNYHSQTDSASGVADADTTGPTSNHNGRTDLVPPSDVPGDDRRPGTDLSMIAEEPSSPASNPPPTGRLFIARECQNLRLELRQDLARWRSEEVKNLLSDDEASRKQVKRLRARFDRIEKALEDVPDTPVPIEEPASSSRDADDRQVWLKFEYYSGGSNVYYYYNCESKAYEWDTPQGPIRISDLETMDRNMSLFADKARLVGATLLSGSATARGSASPSRARPKSPARQVSASPSGPDSIAPSRSTSVREIPASSADTQSVAPHGASSSTAMPFGGREAQQIADNPAMAARLYGHSGGVPATFFPARIDQNSASFHLRTALPGTIPWRTVLMGSIALIFLWCLALVWVVLKAMFNIELVVANDDVPTRPGLTATLLDVPELVYNGPWPHAFFRLEDLACHPSLGDTLVLAERYAVHTLDLSSASTQLHSSSSDCLSAAPLLQGRGLANVAIACVDGTSHECNLTLVGFDGHDGLKCPFQAARSAQTSKASKAVHVASSTQRLAFLGGNWHIAAAGVDSSVWAVGQDSIVQLVPQDSSLHGTEVEMVPRVDYPHPATSNITALAILRGQHILALESSGGLHVWPQQGGAPSLWRIPDAEARRARWHGLCASSSSLFFAGTRLKDKSVGIWRVALPEALADDSSTVGPKVSQIVW